MSTELQRIVKNFVSLMTGTVFVRAASFIATLYMARVLGPADFGQLYFALAVALALSFLANFGLDNLIVREVARRQEGVPFLLGDALILKMLSLPLGVLAALLLSGTDTSATLLFIFVAGYSVLHSYLLLLCAIFRGLERMEFQAFFLSVQVLLIAVGSSVAVRLTGQATPVAAVHLLVTALVLGLSYVVLLGKGIRPRYRWQPAVWRQLVRTVLPFGLIITGQAVYDRQSIVFITLFSGEAAAGWFSAVYAFVPVLVNIPTTLVNTLFPCLAQRTQSGHHSVVAMCEMSLKYTNLISFPLAVCLFAGASTLVPLLFGDQYHNSVALMRSIALGLPSIFLTVVLIGVFQTMDRQRVCAAGLWGALGIATPACLVATWLGGYQVGALAYTLSHLLLTGILFGLFVRTVGWVDLGQVLGRPALAGAGMAFVTYVGQGRGVWVMIPVALCSYVVMLGLVGAVGKREWAVLQAWLKHKKARDVADPELGHEVHW